MKWSSRGENRFSRDPSRQRESIGEHPLRHGTPKGILSLLKTAASLNSRASWMYSRFKLDYLGGVEAAEAISDLGEGRFRTQIGGVHETKRRRGNQRNVNRQCVPRFWRQMTEDK